MAQMDGTSTAAEPAFQVNSRDVEAGRISLESEVAVHACPSCRVELEDRYHFDCPECGHASGPSSLCRACGGPLSIELVRYVAEGATGGSVSKLLSGVCCKACDVFGVEEHELAELGELADNVSLSLELLPEAGIFTRERLEVLADADVCGAGEPTEIVKQRDGMTLRVGSPSDLFEAALPVITEHEPDDIFSPTLSVEPGPPYTPAQRRTFHQLLALVQRELGAPVTCWSASVGLSEEPAVDPVLTEQLLEWSGDGDGRALALYHAITAGQAPGRFTNSVRLLERVLDVGSGQDLSDVLSRRVRELDRPPVEILQQLWLAMHPGRAFDESRVCVSMQAFHARHAASPEAREGAPLPWEEPDFEGYAAWLRRLVSALLGATSG